MTKEKRVHFLDAEVIHYLPGLGPASLAEDRPQISELSADGAHSGLHHPPILPGAVPKPGCNTSHQDALNGAGPSLAV